MRYGDIVYLKFYYESSDKQKKKGIISGDGIASNKLECIPINLSKSDLARLNYDSDAELVIDEEEEAQGKRIDSG